MLLFKFITCADSLLSFNRRYAGSDMDANPIKLFFLFDMQYPRYISILLLTYNMFSLQGLGEGSICQLFCNPTNAKNPFWVSTKIMAVDDGKKERWYRFVQTVPFKYYDSVDIWLGAIEVYNLINKGAITITQF